MRTFSLIVGTLPLLAYPFLALPALMNLIAERNSSMAPLQYGCGVAFSLAVLLYPLAYLIALLLTLTNLKDKAISDRTAQIPLWYLLATVLLMTCWIGAEKAHL